MNGHTSSRRAPLFQLPNQKGHVRALAEYLEGGPVLLAFHRGTW